jgi:ribosomal protein S18 acetylase RimI-like enzyme
MTITQNARLRPVRASDLTFLRELYVATRIEELIAAGLSSAVAQTLLEQQFAVRETSFETAYPQAEWSLVELDGALVGRLTVARLASELRLVDIAVLPSLSNQGIGTALLGDLLARAGEAGLSVTLHVDLTNRAAELYTRMGFTVTAEHGLYRRMDWNAPSLQETPKPGSKP